MWFVDRIYVCREGFRDLTFSRFSVKLLRAGDIDVVKDAQKYILR